LIAQCDDKDKLARIAAIPEDNSFFILIPVFSIRCLVVLVYTVYSYNKHLQMNYNDVIPRLSSLIYQVSTQRIENLIGKLGQFGIIKMYYTQVKFESEQDPILETKDSTQEVNCLINLLHLTKLTKRG